MPFIFDSRTIELFKSLYGHDDDIINRQIKRYKESIDEFKKLFEYEGNVELFSTPGRTEIGGNHTDHNLGKVLAAGVNLDSIAVVIPTENEIATMYSKGFDNSFEVNLNVLDPVEEEEGTTTALIRGIASRFVQLGFKIGGFNAYVNSDVLPGSGLSSSASIEVLIGTIFSHLYNGGKVKPETLAQIGQYAENNFFGKPCGLMDQMACAVGGFVAIDFKDKENPLVEKINFDIGAQGYALIVVDTGGSHADLTEDYASIPREMKTLAQAMGKDVCRELSMDELIANIPMLREKVGDRAILRAMHFFTENDRVEYQVDALKQEDFPLFLQLVKESGNSSWRWLQNVYAPHDTREQGVTLCLALTEHFMKKNQVQGACRVHGGGFAGTIQAYLPKDMTAAYSDMIETIFGKRAVTVLNIRKYGTIKV